MSKLLDFLTFKTPEPEQRDDRTYADERSRPEERDAAVLTDKYPLDGAAIESVSEYRLASLVQYPHF